MARKARNFDAFRVKLNRNQSREEAVDEALRLLENNYFSSNDLPRDENQNAEAEAGNKSVSKEEATNEDSGPSNAEERFKELSQKIEARKKNGEPNEEVLDDVLRLLENARLNSDDALRVRRKRRTFTAVLNIFTGLLLVFAAAAMIIVELPQWLKGPTLYYFSVHDGITVSDVLAVLIIGVGSVLFMIGFAEFIRRSR